MQSMLLANHISPDHCDHDEDWLSEKLVIKNVARKQSPGFTLLRSLEYEYACAEGTEVEKSGRIKATSTPRRLLGSWRWSSRP